MSLWKKLERSGLYWPENVADIFSKLVSHCVGHFLHCNYLWAVLSCFKSHTNYDFKIHTNF